MHVVHDGAATAPPLLLLHGSGAASGCWSPIVPALAAHRHVIRVDLPGCGRSPAPPTFDVPAQAQRVAQVLDGLGAGPIAVAGHSSGGYVATALAEQRPDLVDALTLISTGPSLHAFLPQPAVLRILTGPPLGRALWAVRTDAMVRQGLRAACARPVHIPDDAVAEMKATTWDAFQAVLRASTDYIAERSVPARLAALATAVPTLVIFGAADPRWNPARASEYEPVPGARVVMLPGVGHLPMWEDPEQTAALLGGRFSQ